MSGGGFEEVAFLGAFFFVIWLAGRFMKMVHISPLLGQIIAGVVMGPNVLNVVPYSTKVIPVYGDDRWGKLQQQIEHPDYPDNIHLLPSILDLVGRIGVILMILESGLHIDFHTLKEVGARACLVAILGTALPVVAGVGVMLGMNYGLSPSIAVGVALAPTSVGIALNLLSEQKQLDSVFGQTIVTAAFVDDVLSLLALVLLISFNKGDLTALTIFIPVFGSLALVGGGGLIALYVAPPFMKCLQNKIHRNPVPSMGPRDESLLVSMFLVLCLFAYVAELIGSHLLGAFVAGVVFSKVPRALMVWKRQVKRIVYWMVRLFFCATVAFSIPIKIMLDPTSFAFGLLLGFAGCITKLVAGIVLKEDRLIVGSAMVPRGEFAYLIAQRCFSAGMIDKQGYAVLVWALVLATVIAPFGFRFVLMRKMAKKTLSKYCAFQIQITGSHHTGVLREICECLHEEAFDVIQARMETDGEVDVEIFIVAPRGGTQVDIDPATLAHFKSHLTETLDDDNAQVEVTALSKTELDDIQGKMPDDSDALTQGDSKIASSGILIKLMVEHQRDTFALITQKLDQMNLVVKTANIQDFGGNMDVDEFYVEDKEGKKLDQMSRERIRDQMTNLFKTHNVKGEVMVRFVHKEPTSFQEARHNVMREVQKLHADAYHVAVKNPTVPLDKIIKQLNERGLDVLSCKKSKNGEDDNIDLVVLDKEKNNGSEESDKKMDQKKLEAFRKKNRSREITNSLRNVLTSHSELRVGILEKDGDEHGKIIEMTGLINEKTDEEKESVSDGGRSKSGQESPTNQHIRKMSGEKLVLQFHGHTGHATRESHTLTAMMNRMSNTSTSVVVPSDFDQSIAMHRVRSIHQMKFVDGKFTTDRMYGKRKRQEITGKEDVEQQYV